MRYLVITDVHGNRFGLEQVLADSAREYDRVLCLGDVVGYGAHPNQCCELLREADAICLMGNHDAAALEQLDISWFNPVATEAILWTRAQMSEENKKWLAGLPPQLDLGAEEDFQAVHASLREPLEEYVLDDATAGPNLLIQERGLCLFGHTHHPCVFAAPQDKASFNSFRDLRAADLAGGEFQIDLEPELKYLLNPGSCGQPRDGDPRARYAIWDADERWVHIFASGYNVAAARDAILQAGLPRMLGDRLTKGQ
jgi:predicted phosphodiesterase